MVVVAGLCLSAARRSIGLPSALHGNRYDRFEWSTSRALIHTSHQILIRWWRVKAKNTACMSKRESSERREARERTANRFLCVAIKRKPKCPEHSDEWMWCCDDCFSLSFVFVLIRRSACRFVFSFIFYRFLMPIAGFLALASPPSDVHCTHECVAYHAYWIEK